MLKCLFIKKPDGKQFKIHDMKAKKKNLIIGIIEAVASYALGMFALYEIWQQNIPVSNWKILLPLAVAIVLMYVAIQRIPQWIALIGFSATALFWVFSEGEPNKTPLMIAAVITACAFITYAPNYKKYDGEEEKSDHEDENL